MIAYGAGCVNSGGICAAALLGCSDEHSFSDCGGIPLRPALPITANGSIGWRGCRGLTGRWGSRTIPVPVPGAGCGCFRWIRRTADSSARGCSDLGPVFSVRLLHLSIRRRGLACTFAGGTIVADGKALYGLQGGIVLWMSHRADGANPNLTCGGSGVVAGGQTRPHPGERDDEARRDSWIPVTGG
jgi:hypothetical protein